MQTHTQWLEQFVNNSHIGVLVVDKERNNLFVNDRLSEMFGYDKEKLLSTNAEIFHVNHDTFLKFAELAFDAVLKGKPLGIDYQFKHADGSLFWVHIAGDPIGAANEVLWTMVDITPRIEAQQKIEDINYNLEQYLEAIDKIGIGLFVVDENYNTRYMNKTMISWFGDHRGKTCYSSVAGLSAPCPYCKLPEVIYENKKVSYEPTTLTGESFEIVATSIKNSDGTTSKMEFIRNVTDQKKVQEKLKEEREKFDYQAHHDVLTGLPNRLLFTDRLSQSMEKAKRNNSKLALLFIDLDHFKEINDSLGHDIGDKILQEVTQRLQESLRDEDTLARLGGDEFTLILEDLVEAQDASMIATKILNALSDSIKIDEHTLYVSSSIGISIFPDDGGTTQNLLKFADSAMYKAKDEGRNNYQFYNESMTELAFERVLMEASLRDAFKNEEFIVYYQPQIDGRDDRLIGMEALVRWKHPSMGIVSPAKFIPLAESTGLIIQIDRYVMKTAMSQLHSWYEEGLNPGVLAMNLAATQLHQEDFIEMFQALMQETGCKAEWLELEVTESQIMKNPQKAIKILQEISDLGVELAIDDFGTGYSSLAYLKRFPINKLKVDQAFVRDLPDDEEDTGIVKAVIALAKALSLRIIAEGVEREDQKAFLIQNNCYNIQGYLYSRPIEAESFKEKFL